jgi:quercetin dioxygenase-like cupin family protein
MTDQGSFLLQPGEGRIVSYLGTTAALKAAAVETGGTYSLIEFTTPPGPAPGPPAHMHPHSEAFYVLEGTLLFLLGDQRTTVAAGGFAFVPGNVVHTFANAGTTPARFLTIFAPGGFEAYFEELAAMLRDAGGPPDPARMAEIARKHGQEAMGPPLQLFGQRSQPTQL